MSFDQNVPPDEEVQPRRWEYRELSIQLNLSTLDFPAQHLLIQRFEQIVKRRLAEVAAEGWEPASPTMWGALQTAGRLRRRRTSPFTASRSFRPAYVYEYVTVRLRRPVTGS
jgi:hypothetical protein